jgi:hypothetical protein
MAAKVIGLDTAKHVFQAHGADALGREGSQKAPEEKSVIGFLQ